MSQTNNMFARTVILFWTLIPLVPVSCSLQRDQDDTRPNIVLIVADDLGYGDIGCYGGDIETPNIDALAFSGIRFSRFHSAPMCAPTRAMLLSGNDNHIAGMGVQGLVSEVFGYEGRLTDRVVTIPELLGKAGYHTYMAGKWHLGTSPESNPEQRGFEHSFALLQGAGNHYNSRSALAGGYSDYTEDGDSTGWKTGSYSTDFYTDKIIEFIDRDKDDGKPVFVYAAYTSPHWPLQVDKAYWQKYRGKYDDGYEKLRGKRLNSLKEAGMIPQEATLPRLHESVKPWDSLSEEEQRIEIRKMELYAGMVDNLDFNIGRLVQYIKDIDRYDNTVFVFMSDNGAAYRDFYYDDDMKVLQEYFHNEYENMGNPDSYVSYGPQWAEACSSPFRYFKDYATEGGTNTTLILCGAGVKRKSEIRHEFTTVMDLAPTFYELAGIRYPITYEGQKVYPLKGTSLLPFIAGGTDEIHSSDYVFALEHNEHAMLRKGNWKITNFIKPFERSNFGLYNLSEDPGEQNDLRYSEPEKYKELLTEWEKFADEIQLQIPAPAGD